MFDVFFPEPPNDIENEIECAKIANAYNETNVFLNGLTTIVRSLENVRRET